MSDSESPPLQHRVRILAVGSNAVSAFYSWRLASSKACEVTVVWRRNWQTVQDYGIAFQSDFFGSERWKPAHVVQQVEEAVDPARPYDYVLVCVKVIPELYELADVIADVVTPSHTCILLNTTTTIGVEKSLGVRFPKNLIVSLVNFAELNQTGACEFEHLASPGGGADGGREGGAKVWIGTALRNETIPEETQQDMAESLALTLEAGSVDCHVSHNILQQQWEKMMGPIAFHTLSVIAQEPNFKSLEADPYTNRIIHGLLNECLEIARRQGCSFSKSYITDLISSMISPFPPPESEVDPSLLTTMYQDLLANRPLEFEVYLGNPVRMAEELGVHIPNLQALYAIGRHINKFRTRPDGGKSPQIPAPRQLSTQPRPQVIPPQVNGRGRGPPPGVGPRSFSDGSHPPPVAMNGRGGRPTPNGSVRSRTGSVDGEFDQFKDIVAYGDHVGEDIPTGGEIESFPPANNRRPPPSRAQTDYDLRSKELVLRERELQLRERELEIQRRQGRIRHNVPSTIMDDEEDEDEIAGPGTRVGPLPENVDMMSMTGRRTRNKAANTAAIRSNKSFGGDPPSGNGSGSRLMSFTSRTKRGSTSASIIAATQATFNPLNENPLMGYTSNRYPGVDTRTLAATSRANSMTSQMNDFSSRTGSMINSAYPPMSRGPPPNRNGPMMPPGPSMRGRMGPPPPQHDYVASRYPEPSLPPKDLGKVRSTTGSASASSASLGGNGESHSSSSSLEPGPNRL